MRLFFFFTLFISLFFCKPSLAQAQTITGWQQLGYPYHQWEIVGNEIKAFTDRHNTKSFLVSDVSTPIAENFSFSFILNPMQGVDHNFVWNFIDEENYYQVHFTGSSIWMTRFVDRNIRLENSVNFTVQQGQTYAVRLEQIGDQLSLAIDNQSVLGMHDWSHDERSRGAVGFKLAPGAITPVESHFLDPQLNNVDTLLLPVDRLLQTNFNWRYFEYDSASQWSTDPSIGRWGCALTSLTMVMNYHQLEMMPDGKEVNPRYVNDWLKSQPDGYVGEGLLNWWAATRLIKEISDQYSTAEKQLPKLEFSRQAVDWQNAARSALTAGNPLIAQVPGHFVVVNGFEHSTDSFFIQDPFYDYTRLEQHQQTLSLRLFTPSQTDLSAVVIYHPPDTAVDITNHQGEIVSQTWKEMIETPQTAQTNQPINITAISKPAEENYTIDFPHFSSAENITILSYNQDAEARFLTLPENILETQKINFKFSKNNGAIIIEGFNWQAFLNQLSTLYEQQLISEHAYQRLSKLISYAQQADQTVWSRYQHYLKNILELEKNNQNQEKISELQLLLQ